MLQKVAQSNGSMVTLSTLELLEAAGCAIDKRNGFNAWCEAHNVFEFLTQDYISKLSSYLKTKAILYQYDDNKHCEKGSDDGDDADADDENSKTTNNKKKFTVLELGAGNGRLAFFLRRELTNSMKGAGISNTHHQKKKKVSNNSGKKDKSSLVTVDFIAIDHGGWSIRKNATTSDLGKDGYVEKLDYKKALLKYQPDLVIVSWMPMFSDWTKEIRATPSVKEYILIGESDDGCCGNNWETWGNAEFWSGSNNNNNNNNMSPSASKEVTTTASVVIAPYMKDGWERVNHEEMSDLQLSRFDSEDFVGNSKTVSFIRK
jgi:hypothetical protein